MSVNEMTKELRSRRALCSLTQKDIANKIGISNISYREKELGKIDFKSSEIKKMKYVFNLTPEEIDRIFFTL